MRMRDWIRIVAVFLIGAGMSCLPNVGAGPKHFTSLYSWLADSGVLMRMALVMIVGGIMIFVMSFIGRRE